MAKDRQWPWRATWLITGAASGIGRATSDYLAAGGAALVLVDRDAERLATAERELRECWPDVRIMVRHLDVADEAAVAALCRSCVEAELVPEVVVNNAGRLLIGELGETCHDDWSSLWDTNVWGVANVCRAFVPELKRRRRGHVVNVASSAGFAAVRVLGAYSVSKYAVIGFTEALRQELGAYGASASAVCPGLVRTPIVLEALAARGAAQRVRASREELDAELQRRGIAPEAVAKAIVRAVVGDAFVLPVGPDARLLWLAKRVAPSTTGRLLDWLASRS